MGNYNIINQGMTNREPEAVLQRYNLWKHHDKCCRKLFKLIWGINRKTFGKIKRRLKILS